MSRLPLLAALAVLSAWLLALLWLQPSGVVDETGHQLAIERIQRGDWERTSYLVMLPGYHVLVAGLSWPFGAVLWTSRLLTFAMSVATLLLVDAAARRQRGTATPAVLLTACLPFYLPFTSLVYTDACAVMGVAAALLLHIRGRYHLAAVALLGACLVRQSSIVWGLFLVGWMVLDAFWPGPAAREAPSGSNAQEAPPTLRALLPRMGGYLTLLIVAALVLLLSDSLMSQAVDENRPQPNQGNFYLMSWAALVLWLPLWLPRLPAALRSLARQPLRAISLTALAAAGTALLALTFSNWHPWNQSPDFLRNAPLIHMAASPLARWLGAAMAMAGLLSLPLSWRGLAGRRLLLWLSVCTLIYFMPHSLAEARYAIMPFFLADFVAGTPVNKQWQQAAWYLGLSLIACGLFLSGTFVIW